MLTWRIYTIFFFQNLWCSRANLSRIKRGYNSWGLLGSFDLTECNQKLNLSLNCFLIAAFLKLKADYMSFVTHFCAIFGFIYTGKSVRILMRICSFSMNSKIYIFHLFLFILYSYGTIAYHSRFELIIGVEFVHFRCAWLYWDSHALHCSSI